MAEVTPRTRVGAVSAGSAGLAGSRGFPATNLVVPGVLAASAAAVVVAVACGSLWVNGVWVGLRAAPFAGRWEWHGGPGLVPALVLAAATVNWGPTLAARLRWRSVPLVTGLGAVAWTTALAACDGWARLTHPLTIRHEYEPFAARVHDLGPFLRTYVDRLGDYPIHVQGHPPGPVIVAWLLDRIGLAGAGWLAALAIAGWGVAAGAALVAARAVAGEAAARRAAPALVLLPAAVWAGTSLDALFAGVIALAIALPALATARPMRTVGSDQLNLATEPRALPTAQPGGREQAQTMVEARPQPGGWEEAGAGAMVGAGLTRRGGGGRGWMVAMVGAGVVMGVALLLSYGSTVLLLVPVGVVVVRSDRPAAAVRCWALGIAVPLSIAALAGFWWLDGLAATRAAYWAGIAPRRSGAYFTLLGNPAVLAVAVGPAVVLGLARQISAASAENRRFLPRFRAGRASRTGRVGRAGRGAELLPVLALTAVVLADLSQYARGEVERIWLPFVPWLALAAPGDRRPWLAAQAGLTLLVQSILVSPW